MVTFLRLSKTYRLTAVSTARHFRWKLKVWNVSLSVGTNSGIFAQICEWLVKLFEVPGEAFRGIPFLPPMSGTRFASWPAHTKCTSKSVYAKGVFLESNENQRRMPPFDSRKTLFRPSKDPRHLFASTGHEMKSVRLSAPHARSRLDSQDFWRFFYGFIDTTDLAHYIVDSEINERKVKREFCW